MLSLCHCMLSPLSSSRGSRSLSSGTPSLGSRPRGLVDSRALPLGGAGRQQGPGPYGQRRAVFQHGVGSGTSAPFSFVPTAGVLGYDREPLACRLSSLGGSWIWGKPKAGDGGTVLKTLQRAWGFGPVSPPDGATCFESRTQAPQPRPHAARLGRDHHRGHRLRRHLPQEPL